MTNSNADIEVLSHQQIAPLTTMGVGGPADFLVRVHRVNAVCQALALAESYQKPIMVIGGGSNVIFSDLGFPGILLNLCFRELKVVYETDEQVCISVEAGHNWDDLVACSVTNGWSGIECLSGIPGSVGAAPIQNIGAYGQEVGEVIKQVRCIDINSGHQVVLSNKKCLFSYRDSFFKSVQKKRYVITSVELSLSKVARPKIAYKELADQLLEHHPNYAEADIRKQLAYVRQTVLKIRRSKSMVFDPRDPHSRSCGSFFLNPIVDHTQLEQVIKKTSGQDVPKFKHGDHWKIPAAWLVEQAGFPKGYREGNIGLSPRHALAIVNYGGKAADIVALSQKIRLKVDNRFAVNLTPEPELVTALERL